MSKTFAVRPFAALLFVSCLVAGVTAQQTPPASNAPAPSAQQPSSSAPNPPASAQQPSSQQEKPGETKPGETGEKKDTQTNQSGTSNDRLFYALPNFLTLETTRKLPPLTVKQKFAVVTRGSFDYVQYPWYAFLAGLSQAENSEPGYGQGAEGYGKRYGAAFADGTIENYFTGAILPSVLHQDPRFYQSGHGSFMHRVIYAASRNLITRTDAGNSQFNYSEVLGGGMAAFISTYSYHPSADKTVANSCSVWATQYGYDTLTLVIKEFWPDIRRKFSRKKESETPVTNPSNPSH